MTASSYIDPSLPVQSSLQLLHIEDEASDADLVAFELEHAGLSHIQITVAERLADAMAKIRSQHFDVALLDLNLPDSTGLETYQRLRREAPHLPVILLTGFDEEGAAQHMLSQGVQDYLPKKYIKGDLLSNVIRFAMERHRLQTELQARAGELEVSESRLRRIIEADTDAIMIVDNGGVVRFVNPATLRLFGVTFNELLDRPIGFPIVPGDIEEREIIREDGSKRIVELHAVEIVWEDGIAVVASLRDITQRKELEQQLLQSQKMDAIGQLTGGLAHDFNNLLGVIIGNLEILESRLGNNTELLPQVHAIQKAASSGASLTKRLLAFARRQTLMPTCISVNDLIQGMQELIARTLGANIELSTSLSPDAPPVMVDRGELENVILNLAINGGDAIRSRGRITFETAAVYLDDEYGRQYSRKVIAGRYVKITVTDNGAGMSADVQRHIYEPFFTTKEQGRGTGLGLSMIYGFVKQSKGYIDIESESGRGTTVNIYIPQASEEEQAQLLTMQQTYLQERSSGDTEEAPAAEGASKTILVVDDTEELLMLAEMILEQEGYEVLTAGNAQQALAHITDGAEIDVVLTDIIMPGEMNGIELGERINDHDPQIKVLYTSGYSADALKAKAGVSIAGRLVNKPYRSQELLDSVRKVLDGKSLD